MVGIANQFDAVGSFQEGQADNARPSLKLLLAAGAEVQHLTTEFMAHYRRFFRVHKLLEAPPLKQLGKAVCVMSSMEIAATDTAH